MSVSLKAFENVTSTAGLDSVNTVVAGAQGGNTSGLLTEYFTNSHVDVVHLHLTLLRRAA